MRITAQLIDAADDGHLWAERFDRDLTDIFAVQDDVTGRIVSALSLQRSPRIGARAFRAPSAVKSSPGLLQHGVDYVLHAILDFIVDGYLPIVEAIEEEVLETEQRTLDAFLERRKSAGYSLCVAS